MGVVRVPLEVMRVGTPCDQDWSAMAGDERRRFCAGCGKHVHNLSAITRAEAERLVCEQAGNLCVRFAVAGDGGVQTLEYRTPATSPRRSWRFWALLGGVGATIAAAANVLVGRPA